MEILRILNKSNIYSVIVAIIIASAVSSALMMGLQEPASILSGVKESQMYGGTGLGWQTSYLQPVILLALQLFALEILCRISVAVSKKSKK